MPLIHKFYYNHAKIGIWHITEALDFFENDYKPLKKISHPKNKLLHAAAWYTAINIAKPLIILPNYLPSGAPTDVNNNYYLSLSHTNIYAAAALHTLKNIGVDIEQLNSKAIIIKNKFANALDISSLDTLNLNNEVHKFSLLWSIKEAAFKCMQLHGINFKSTMSLIAIEQINLLAFNFKLAWNNITLSGTAKKIGDIWVACIIKPL